MIDLSELTANHYNRVFHCLGKPGDWEFLRDEGVGVKRRYVFARPSSKNPDKRVEISLSCQQCQEKIYEVTARHYRPERFKLDLARLEAFRLERA